VISCQVGGDAVQDARKVFRVCIRFGLAHPVPTRGLRLARVHDGGRACGCGSGCVAEGEPEVHEDAFQLEAAQPEIPAGLPSFLVIRTAELVQGFV
jgi:hypothetical protein